MEDDAPEAPAPAVPGGPFALAWRNYIKSMFKRGYAYRLSCKPDAPLYIAENKTLAGKEDKAYEGEALGRKLAVVFYEHLPGPGGLVQRVHKETLGMKQHLLTIAELLQQLGGPVVPADPERTAAQTEILIEQGYELLEITRLQCSAEPDAPGNTRVLIGGRDSC